MSKFQLDAANTTAQVNSYFAPPHPVRKVAFVGMADVGQGNLSYLCDEEGVPLVYFDTGSPLGFNARCEANPIPVLCFAKTRLVVFSHADEDHNNRAKAAAFQASMNGICMVIPKQLDFGKTGKKAMINALDAAGANIYWWPNRALGVANILNVLDIPSAGIEIIECRGNTLNPKDPNHSGIALRVRSPLVTGGGNQQITILSADAFLDPAVFPWNIAPYATGQPVAMAVVHHGADEDWTHLPVPVGANRPMMYSFGSGNTYGHPFHRVASPDGVQGYRAKGWAAADQVRTSGQTTVTRAAARGNIALLLPAAAPLACRPGIEPSAGSVTADYFNAAIALIATAGTAARAFSGAPANTRVPIAAAYASALLHYAHRAVPALLRDRSLAQAQIVTHIASLGHPIPAWLAGCFVGHVPTECSDECHRALPLARAAALLALAASVRMADELTTAAIGRRAAAPGSVRIKIREGVEKIALDAGNAVSAARIHGRDAASAYTHKVPGLRFGEPHALALNAANHVLIADALNHRIVEVDYTTGDAVSLAGAARTPAAMDGAGFVARFQAPGGIAVGGTAAFVADTKNHTIRRIDLTNNTVSTVTGMAGTAGNADGVAVAAQFDSPHGVVYDDVAKVLYVADTGNHTLRRIDIGSGSGQVDTIIGQAGAGATIDGWNEAVRLNGPTGLALSPSGVVFMTETHGHTVRKIVPVDALGTLAGLDNAPGAVDGTGTTARFNSPRGIASDGQGGFFVSDTQNHVIRRIDAHGAVVVTYGAFGMAGHSDIAGNLQFNMPSGLAFDVARQHLYVADTGNNVVRQIDAATKIGKVVAGAAPNNLKAPETVLLTPGWLVIADTGNHAIRFVNLSRLAFHVMGTGPGHSNTGGAEQFNSPAGLAWDAANKALYIADRDNHAIRKFADGSVTTPIGAWGAAAHSDGNGTAAQFYHPTGLCFASATDLIVLDHGNHAVRRVDLSNMLLPVTTIFGDPANTGTLDGRRGAARLRGPRAAALDVAAPIGSGNLAIVDDQGHTVRMYTRRRSMVSTVAGQAGTPGHADAVGAAAQFNTPRGILVHATGVVTVADAMNHVVRKIDATGAVTTFAGRVGVPGEIDAALLAATFDEPSGLAMDVTGSVYVGDVGSHLLRQIAGGAVTTIPDVIVAAAVAQNLLENALATGGVAAAPAAVANAAQALSERAALAAGHVLTLTTGSPTHGHAQVPALAAHNTAALLAAPSITNVENGFLDALAAAAGVGPALEVHPTCAAPGVPPTIPEALLKVGIVAAAAALAGYRNAGASCAQDAVSAARAATCAARGGPVIGCHRFPTQCGNAVCTLTVQDF